MKTFLKTGLFMLALIATIIACKKDKLSDSGQGTVTSETYTFNKATQSFDLGNEVKSEITAPDGVRLIYAYLVRNNATDSLIYITTDIKDNPVNYTLNIPTSAFPVNRMSQVTGVKVMVKQGNNSTLEGFIPIKFFNPDLPQFDGFPLKITADLNMATAITGNLTSLYGIKQVDLYDDFQTENTYVLVNSINTINGAKQYALNYSYTYRKAAQHIKIVVTDIYNQTNTLIINMPVDVSLFKPKFASFPAKITPVTNGTTPVNGNITSVTGLKKVDIYDDRSGSYALVSTINNLNGAKTYTLSTTYAYKKRASNIKIIAIDAEDLQSELIIPLDVTYGSIVYKDIVMTAQTLGTNTVFLENGTTIGNCDLTANEAKMLFVFYGTSSGPTLYNPSNATSGTFPANMKCNGTAWTVAQPTLLKDTKFRVLINGATSGQTDIYSLLAANEIDDLSDTFFSSKSLAAPSSSAPRYDVGTPSASLFNVTTARLVYLRIITTGQNANTKNALMEIKEIVSNVGNSTIKFDLYVQK